MKNLVRGLDRKFNYPIRRRKNFIILAVLFLLVLMIGGSYSFINLTLTGGKRQVITAGVLSLVLDEDVNNLTIQNALPVYDEVGMIQAPFTFRLINNGSSGANYKLMLVEIGAGTFAKTDVKYGLTKDGELTIDLLSNLDEDGVIDSGTIGASPETIEYELRLWVKDSITDNSVIEGRSLSYRVDIEINQETENAKQTITIAGVEKEVAVVEEAMFNYTSEGVDSFGGESTSPTNGIYSMLDDDGMSFFYRGEVDNLVQFGEYGQDYYVYRSDGYDFTSLEACAWYAGSEYGCVKTKKYDAGTPMYWKIIRFNGDGTIRMIYVGTSKDAIGQDTGIGLSSYNQEYSEPKHTGYTYDITDASATKSFAKAEIDNWYSTYLATTEYDEYVADGKFCSDSSGYEYNDALDGYIFNSYKNSFFGTINSSPSFKCPETEENFGGSYTLKAGLITLDEVIAAGGQTVENLSYYLHTGTKGSDDGWYYWSMSPGGYLYGDAVIGVSDERSSAGYSFAGDSSGLLRPVINLKAGTKFQNGTDGSISTPYQIIR